MIIKFLKPELTVWTVLKNRKFVFVKKTSSSYLSNICYALFVAAPLPLFTRWLSEIFLQCKGSIRKKV